VLQHIIDQIYLQHPAATDLPTKRPIFNFEHRDLRRWRVFARTLYFLLAITRRLEADPNTCVPPTSSGKSQGTRRLSGNTQGGRGGQIMAVSAPEIRPPDRPSPARGLLSTAFSPEHSGAAYRKFPSEASGEATGASRHFESSLSPATYRMPSASPAARVIHGNLPAPTTPNPPPGSQFRQPPATPTTAYDLLTEAEDYASFPSESCRRFALTGIIALPILISFGLDESEDSNNFLNQFIDWQEWEADSVARPKGADRMS
jgi:hypothetical protein